MLGDGVQFFPYRDLSGFVEDVDAKRIELFGADFIIVDFEFGVTNAGKKDIGRFLRDDLNFRGTTLMCSLHSYFGEYDELIRSSFDYVIDKLPLTLTELLQYQKR